MYRLKIGVGARAERERSKEQLFLSERSKGKNLLLQSPDQNWLFLLQNVSESQGKKALEQMVYTAGDLGLVSLDIA